MKISFDPAKSQRNIELREYRSDVLLILILKPP